MPLQYLQTTNSNYYKQKKNLLVEHRVASRVNREVEESDKCQGKWMTDIGEAPHTSGTGWRAAAVSPIPLI